MLLFICTFFAQAAGFIEIPSLKPSFVLHLINAGLLNLKWKLQ